VGTCAVTNRKSIIIKYNRVIIKDDITRKCKAYHFPSNIIGLPACRRNNDYERIFKTSFYMNEYLFSIDCLIFWGPYSSAVA
jgi:hypothetical protein